MKKIDRLKKQKRLGEPIACLTVFDYPTARLFAEAGADVLLVGDSLGMVVLGMPDTTGVTMDDMVRHTQASARGAKDGGGEALLIADLPYRSYRTRPQAVRNAQKLVAAGAEAVKLEGGVSQVRQIRAIVEAGIPVAGHIGMLPQSIKVEGGYKKKGRREGEEELLLKDARALEEAGASLIVLESIVPDVAREITESLSVPTIGVGAGPHCSGQVLVSTDVTGYFPWFVPPFAVVEAAVAEEMRGAAERFVSRVKAGR